MTFARVFGYGLITTLFAQGWLFFCLALGGGGFGLSYVNVLYWLGLVVLVIIFVRFLGKAKLAEAVVVSVIWLILFCLQFVGLSLPILGKAEAFSFLSIFGFFLVPVSIILGRRRS